MLLGLIAGSGVGYLLLSDGDDDHVALAAGEILLEPASSLGPESFTGEVFAAPPPTVRSSPLPRPSPSPAATGTSPTPATASPSPSPAATSPGATTPPGTVVVARAEGSTPGLYGGTRDQTRCEPSQLVRFLEQNPDKAAAWAAALNADPTLRWTGGNQVRGDQVAAYVAELTPVELLTDTRVTNHGFRAGRPTPRQSVLQAGTAVLVDAYGVPRVRCACGNPLIPPQPVATAPTYVGDPWDGFSPSGVGAVVPSTTVINIFVLTDIDGGGTFERPVGSAGDRDALAGTTPPSDATPTPEPSVTLSAPPDVALGTGDVQITLVWDGDHDVDLHVFDPDGTEIFYASPSSPSGGQLDVDQVPSCGDTARHVENVFWPPDGAPSGRYSAFVRNLGGCTGDAATFSLEIRVGGQVIRRDGGSLSQGEDSTTIEFDVAD